MFLPQRSVSRSFQLHQPSGPFQSQRKHLTMYSTDPLPEPTPRSLHTAPPEGLDPSLAPSALRTLRHALQAPAQDRQLAASAALGLGLASLAFMPREEPPSAASARVGLTVTPAAEEAPGALEGGGALEEAEGVVASVAALLEDKEPKVRLWIYLSAASLHAV